MITLNAIAGYATQKAVLTLLLFLCRRGHTTTEPITPSRIIVTDNGYDFLNTDILSLTDIAFLSPECAIVQHQYTTAPLSTSHTGHLSPEEQEKAYVYTIGAILFYVLLGKEVFDGKTYLQTSATPIPRIPSTHISPAISNIIYRCLNFNSTLRPTLLELITVAQQTLSHPQPRCQRPLADNDTQYKKSLVAFWPEEMVSIILLFILSLLPHRALSQNIITENTELTTLVQHCIALRTKSNHDLIAAQLNNDLAWTLMDELPIDKTGECTLDDHVARCATSTAR